MARPTRWQQRALEAAEDQSLMSKYGFDYAIAFMQAALKLRGWTVAEAAPETRRDVDLMVYEFNRQYTRMMDHGWDPALTAEALTNQWWDLGWSQQ